MAPSALKKNEKIGFRNPRIWLLLVISAAILVIGFNLIYYAMFLVENRPGTLLFDPVHYFLPAPINFSNAIFLATYSGVFIITVDSLLVGPSKLSKIFLGYSIILLLRSASMILVPLDPPVGLIPLLDPLIAYFNPEPFVATRDLFFSGHCATLTFFYINAQQKYIKYFLGFLNIFIVVAISLQRVHYTIDIIGGIIVAYGVCLFMDFVFKRYIHPFLIRPTSFSISLNKKSLTKKR